MPPAELEKRLASFSTRRALLKSNPLLYISKTRLSVRQVPIFVSDKCLKKLALHAAKNFEEEVKQGKRDGISEDEKRRDIDEDAKDEPSDEEADSLQKAKTKKQPRTFVKQSKIVRKSDRVDAVTNKHKSKGYGFVEMGTHTDALRVLRWVNNNPDVYGLVEKWWIEELKELISSLEKNAGSEAKDKQGGDGLDVGSRIKRARAELERLEGGGEVKGKKGKKTMVVEFSIENAQVVKRRKTQQKENAEVSKYAFIIVQCSEHLLQAMNDAPKSPRKRFIDEVSSPTSKRRKTSHDNDASNSKPSRKSSLSASKKEKEFIDSSGKSKGKPGEDGGKRGEGSKLGGIIGRKRKMRSLKAAKKVM